MALEVLAKVLKMTSDEIKVCSKKIKWEALINYNAVYNLYCIIINKNKKKAPPWAIGGNPLAKDRNSDYK